MNTGSLFIVGIKYVNTKKVGQKVGQNKHKLT